MPSRQIRARLWKSHRLYRPRLRGHRVDGNRLVRRLTGILGDTEIAAPLLRIDPGASTALGLAAGRPTASRCPLQEPGADLRRRLMPVSFTEPRSIVPVLELQEGP